MPLWNSWRNQSSALSESSNFIHLSRRRFRHITTRRKLRVVFCYILPLFFVIHLAYLIYNLNKNGSMWCNHCSFSSVSSGCHFALRGYTKWRFCDFFYYFLKFVVEIFCCMDRRLYFCIRFRPILGVGIVLWENCITTGSTRMQALPLWGMSGYDLRTVNSLCRHV